MTAADIYAAWRTGRAKDRLARSRGMRPQTLLILVLMPGLALGAQPSGTAGLTAGARTGMDKHGARRFAAERSPTGASR